MTDTAGRPDVTVTTTVTDTAGRIRVAIVDDQELFVYGVRMLVESQPDFELVGTATDGERAVRLMPEWLPDIVLMDIRMPVMSGIEATHLITRGADRPPRVIVLTTFHQQQAVFQALKHGASAFLTKDSTPELVLDTIRSVHAGALTLPDQTLSVVRQFAETVVNEPAPETALADLSPRETEIFLLAARGLSNSEIAAAAFISETTAKTHIRSILGKLGLQSRVQIVVFAYERRLLR